MHLDPHLQIGRRAFLKNGTLFLSGGVASLSLTSPSTGAESRVSAVRFGLVTDLHFADKPAAGSRYYRETPAKLAAAAKQFSGEKLNFVAELGDLIDAADSVEQELGFLKRINRDFAAICPQRHYVLGNHCVHTLTKEEFLGGVEQPRSYYSFDVGGVHFVVLDCCYRSDGTPYGRKNFEWTDPNVPAEELEWLRSDLAANTNPTIVFSHQRLDVDNHYAAKNAPAVREVLSSAQTVRCVFQGHSHRNDYHDLGGIHYCTLVAMVEGSGVESSGFSVVEVSADETIRVRGFRKQDDYTWKNERRSQPS